MTTLQALNPIDFGPAHHGVHIFDHEDESDPGAEPITFVCP